MSLEFTISAADQFSNNFKKAESGLENLASTSKKVGTAITGLGLAAAGGIGVAISSFAGFESQMNKVGAISGATSADLDRLGQAAREAASTSVFGATEAAQALEYMALAGYDAEQQIGALDGVLALAAASGMDLGRASDIVTDTLSQFGMAAEDAGKASDIFAKAQASANTDVDQMGEALKMVGATANAAGMDLEQTSALLGILADNSIKGSSAGTVLDSAFRDIRNSVQDGAIAIGEAEVAVYDSEGAMRSLTDILADVETATAGMTDAQRDQALGSVFQARSMRGVNVLLNEGTSAVYELESALYSAEGTSAAMTEQMNQGLLGSLRMLGSQFEEVTLIIGQYFAPIIMQATEKLQKITEWFNALSDEQKESIAKWIGLATAAALIIGPALIIIGFIPKIVAGFGAIITVTKALGVALTFLTMNPIGLIITAIAAVIAIGILLYKNWDTVKERVSSAVSAMSDRVLSIFGSIGAFVRETMSNILGFITGLGSAFKNAGAGLIDMMVSGIKNAASRAINAVKDLAQKVRNLLPFSPAKDGPLSDLDRLDFAGPITHSIDAGFPDVQGAMAHMFELPDVSARPARIDRGSSGGNSGGYKRANIIIEMDRRKLAEIIGEELVDVVRMKTGMVN